MIIDKSKYQTKEELFKFLRDNKKTLIAQKKATLKHSDGIIVAQMPISKGFAVKAANNDSNVLLATVVINTTNYLDSHDDVHISGLWSKTLQENKNIFHLQEHQNEFSKIISSGNDLKAYTKEYKWEELGYNFEGETEALIFESSIKRERNDFMFNQYKNGWVDNHSVGMQYVKLDLAINENDTEEKQIWDRYINLIANKQQAINQGFFWAVTEAKMFEGSAVVRGSNDATPTISIENKIIEPSNGTQKTIDTQIVEPSQTKKLSFLI